MARRPLTVPFEPTRHLREDPWAIRLALDVIEYDFGVFTKVRDWYEALHPTCLCATSVVVQPMGCAGDYLPCSTYADRGRRSCGTWAAHSP